MKKTTSIILSAIILLCAITFDAVAAKTSDYKLKAGESIYLSQIDEEIVSAKSSAPNIAEVKDNKITALTKGSAVITAKLKNEQTAEYNIKVTTNPKIIGKKSKAEKFCTFSIKVEGAATTVKYSSSKPKIASITSRGDITTNKVGTTTIEAKVNGITLSFKLKVYIKDIVNHYKETFKKGFTYKLYHSEVGRTPKIVSSNPKIVKVTKNGKLKALKRGKATVTFSRKHAKAIVKVKVV